MLLVCGLSAWREQELLNLAGTDPTEMKVHREEGFSQTPAAPHDRVCLVGETL